MNLVVGALVLVVALQALLIVGLLRSHADILRRLHALDGGESPAGAIPVDFRVRDDLPAPTGSSDARVSDISGSGITDDLVTIGIVGVPHRTLLAFLSSSCLTCQAFWDAFARASDLGLPPDVRVVVVAKDAADESASALRALAPPRVPMVLSSAAWNDYAVPGSPYFVLVDGPRAHISGEGTGASWDQVRTLILEAAANAALEDSNEARIDRELRASGIEPGDPSLYHPAAPESGA